MNAHADSGSMTVGTIALVLAVIGVSVVEYPQLSLDVRRAESRFVRAATDGTICLYESSEAEMNAWELEEVEEPWCFDQRGLDRGACFDERFRAWLEAFERRDIHIELPFTSQTGAAYAKPVRVR